MGHQMFQRDIPKYETLCTSCPYPSIFQHKNWQMIPTTIPQAVQNFVKICLPGAYNEFVSFCTFPFSRRRQ